MLPERFLKHITEKTLFSSSDRLLLAVSGGVDSIILCDLCYHAGFEFEIAHANFQLRGQESILDECFVQGIAERYRVNIHIKKFDTSAYAEANRLSVQVAARELRYQWFDKILKEEGGRHNGKQGAAYVITGHHADDNVETVVMNFFRGTGISGLRGMQAKHNNVVRPLLPFTRKELLEYARIKKLNWREDSSNASDKYSRNYFRNAILPMVYKVYPEAEANLLQNIARFAEAEMLYSQAVLLHKKKLVEQRGSELHVPILKLKKSIPVATILFEIIKPFNFTSHQLSAAMELLDAEQGAHIESATHRIFRNRAWLIISPKESAAAQNILIQENENEVWFNDHSLQLVSKTADINNISQNNGIAELDKHKVRFPLLLRRWKAGDYFYPLGMKKKKKVSRFLIDSKLSPTEKQKVWVIESNKKICWVVGMRIDDRFKIQSSTRQMLRLTVTN